VQTLNRKLLRDLSALKGQSVAIGVVIAAGVMMLIVSVTALDALRLSQERFYANNNFAHVFASLTRAPDGLNERLRAIHGVNYVETRVQAPVRLAVPGFADPVRGLLISIPDGRQPTLNRLHLREGSLPESGRSDQIVVNEPFAEAHRLRPGDTLDVIIRGRFESLSISGVALSPEFIYQIGPADLMPDYERYGVFWMNRRALAHAFGMEGAFNNIVLTLQADAEEATVIEALDQHVAVGLMLDEAVRTRADEIGQRLVGRFLDNR
jgi:putative ABC transport system permease protein